MRLVLCVAVLSVFGVSTCWAQLPAFSGAEGPGATASGGRGGDVYHVTNLEFDLDGVIPGSLRYGLNTAPSSGRTIVFDVGGTIFENGGGPNHWLRVSKSNITVAGQTAPGLGITIAGVGTKWTGDNNILRNFTVRPNKDPVNPNNYTYDAFSLQVKNSIVDHVSASWYTDEGISITDSGANSTVQYATLGEGLTYDGHAFGSIIATETDGTHYSYNHNLYAHNISRMPAIGSETGQTGAVLSFTNNVIYNWRRTKAGYSATGQHSSSNFLGNFYITGNDNGNLTFTGGDDSSSVGYTKIFLDKTDPVTANVGDMNKDGDLDDGVAFTKGDQIPGTGNTFYSGDFAAVSTAFAVTGAVTPDTAPVALQRVLDYGGANWSNRNPIEQRIIDSVRDGSGNVVTDLTSGQQAAEWSTVMAQRPTGGVAPFTRGADWDVDGDGMPGYWEVQHGLNPAVANNNADFDTDGYTDLEEYLNEIAAWPAPAPILFSGANSRYAEIQNWLVQTQTVSSVGAQNAFGDFHWQPSKFDSAVINNGTVEVDAVGQHAGNLVLAMNPGDEATLNITGGWLKVEDAEHGLSDGITSIGDNPSATATLNLTGGKLTTKTLLKGDGGTFNFTGGVLSAETVGFDLVNSGGTIAPGASAGVTHVMGDLTLSSGTLQIELGGDSPGEFDSLVIDGAVMLGGTLEVSLLDGFALASDSLFPILEIAGAQSGQFVGLGEGAIVGNFGEDLFITYAAGDGNDVALYTSVHTPGDFDGDGDVDGADFLVWQRNTDAGSLEAWQSNFGHAPNSGLLAVPEPASAVLIGMAVLGVLVRLRGGSL